MKFEDIEKLESLPTQSTNVEKGKVHLNDGLPVWHAGAPPVEREGVNTRISFSLQTPFNQNLSTNLLRLNPLGPLVDHGSHTVRSNLGPFGVIAPNRKLINDQIMFYINVKSYVFILVRIQR